MGCGESSGTDEGLLLARLDRSRAARSFASQAHQLPATLAHGQTVRHRFALTNPTDRTIRLRRAEASKPCCSSIHLESDVLAAGGSTAAEVEWRVGRATGRKATVFTIETDSADDPTIVLKLIADLRADWEVSPAYAGVPRLRVGEAGEVRMTVVSRRDAAEGSGPPDEIESAAPVHARFVEPARPAVAVVEGIREESREVAATLEPSNAIGVRRGTIGFRWKDGRREAWDVSWEVVPHVQAHPSALFLRRGEPATRSVTVRSAGGPIRILGVTGPFLAGRPPTPDVASDVHELSLNLLVPLDADDAAPVVHIATDSERQPSLDVSVVLAPAREKEVDR